MMKVPCVKCHAPIEVSGDGDYSFIVCKDCNEKNNLPAYKAEVSTLEALGASATTSQKRRIEFLKSKIASIKG